MSSKEGDLPVSLFEGMFLFSPSQSSPLEKEPSLSTPSPSSPIAHPTSAPLDEDLFSDPRTATPPTAPNPPPAAQSSNISRRKKRSSRIGYAREAIDARDADTSGSAGEASETDAAGETEERLDLVRSGISARCEGVRKAATLAYCERRELEGRRRRGEQDVSRVSVMYRELEGELEAACEAEDFERAEKVSECLAAAEEERDGAVNALRGMEMDCDCFDLRMQDVFDLQIAAEEEGVECFEKFAKV